MRFVTLAAWNNMDALERKSFVCVCVCVCVFSSAAVSSSDSEEEKVIRVWMKTMIIMGSDSDIHSVRYHLKTFSFINPFNLHSQPMKQLLLEFNIFKVTNI